MRPAFPDILAQVMAWYDVTYTEIIGRSRRANAVKARQVLAVVAHDCAGMSYPEIAMALGKTNHSTYVDGNRRFNQAAAQLPAEVA